MEKSQWDLKKVRLQGRRLTRLDDFVDQYKNSHIALLREFQDSKWISQMKVKNDYHLIYKCLNVIARLFNNSITFIHFNS